MLGIKNFDWRRHQEVLENFFALARRGNILPGDPPGHEDGWGIAYYRSGAPKLEKSGASVVADKKRYWRTLEAIGRSSILLVHLRKSSWSGTSSASHAHPFILDEFTFAHNGTIRDYKKLRSEIPGGEELSAALDSEVYFRYIMKGISSGLEKAFRQAVRRIRKENKYSALNAIFSDGRRLYGYREYRRNPEYYSLYRASAAGAVFISSEPVSPRARWVMIPRGKLVMF